MISDKDYNAIADDVCEVEFSKNKNPIREENLVASDRYKVLKVADYGSLTNL